MTSLVDPSIFKYPIWIDTSTKKKIHGIKTLTNLMRQLDVNGGYSIASSAHGIIICADYRNPQSIFVRRCSWRETKEQWFKYLRWSPHVNHEVYPSVDKFLEVLKKQKVIKSDLCVRGRLEV